MRLVRLLSSCPRPQKCLCPCPNQLWLLEYLHLNVIILRLLAQGAASAHFGASSCFELESAISPFAPHLLCKRHDAHRIIFRAEQEALQLAVSHLDFFTFLQVALRSPLLSERFRGSHSGFASVPSCRSCWSSTSISPTKSGGSDGGPKPRWHFLQRRSFWWRWGSTIRGATVTYPIPCE